MVRALAVFLLVGSGSAVAAAEEPYGLPLSGEAAETFLRTARLVSRRPLGRGITHSEQYTLDDGTRTCKAVRKTIDTFKRGVTSLEGGGVYVDFTDSWKNEVAAYELDKLIGTGLVPPTVERTFSGTKGSLQLWVEGAMTEAERIRKKLTPPDPHAWNERMYAVRLLHRLAFDTDYRNLTNLILDPSFRVYAIDFSRAFLHYNDLLAEKELTRFSRSALEGLRALDRPLLDAKLGRWLNGPQIEGVLKRRDKILALAARRVQEQGEGAVLY
ncbi:MAG TPA: hypothetical protein VMT70_13560 [Vicinamibacteria bacterium]|nr:hypothetical protein [Vicinamibacteria bacterium]